MKRVLLSACAAVVGATVLTGCVAMGFGAPGTYVSDPSASDDSISRNTQEAAQSLNGLETQEAAAASVIPPAAVAPNP